MVSKASSPAAQCRPFFRTPISAFLSVMAPINGLMAFLLLSGSTPNWMKLSSALVIALSLGSFVRGYWRRLSIRSEGVTFRLLFGKVEIPWEDVKAVGVYSPGGGKGGSEYVYISRRERQPGGTWEIDDDTIQLQNREGLLSEILAAQEKSKPEAVERAS